MCADAATPVRGDPALGVFETVRVDAGRARHAGAHLGRLEASLNALYALCAPDDLSAGIASHAARLTGPHRLRIDAVPAGATVQIGFSVSALGTQPPEPVRCAIAVVPGGLGPHKLRDRARLDALAASGATPLIADEDGTVLEAAWGNLWLREGTRLVTPPADGRLLPGITRARLIEVAASAGLNAVQEPISRERLAAADAVFVTSALRLAVAATVDGPAAPEPAWLGELRDRLTA